MFNDALKSIGISLPGYPRHFWKPEVSDFPQGLMLPAHVILKSGIVYDPCLIQFTNDDPSDGKNIESILPSKRSLDFKTRFACRNLNGDDRNPSYTLFQDQLGHIYYLDYPAQFFLHEAILPSELEEIHKRTEDFQQTVYFPHEKGDVKILKLEWKVEYIDYVFLPISQRPQLNLEQIYERINCYPPKKGSGAELILAPSLDSVRAQLEKAGLNIVPLTYDGGGSCFGPSGEAYSKIDIQKDISVIDLSAGQLRNTSQYVKTFVNFLKGCVLITGVTPLERAYLYSYAFKIYDLYE